MTGRVIERIVNRMAYQPAARFLSSRSILQLRGRSFRVPFTDHQVLGTGLRNVTWKTSLIGRLAGVGSGVFVDIGANVGQTLLDLRASGSDAPYVGFEPNPQCVDYLQRLIAANPIQPARVVPVGLSDRRGVLRLYSGVGTRLDECATTIEGLRPGRALESQFIPVFPFDEIRAEVLDEPAGLIKIDVEGAELDVLRGMKATLVSQRPLILCEVLFADRNASLAASSERKRELAELLRSLDYVVFQLITESDGSDVEAVVEREQFASAYWSHENSGLCDYLFVPSDRSRDIARVATAR